MRTSVHVVGLNTMISQDEALSTEGMETNAEYDAFTEKFKPKLTTDDCFTPPDIYDVVAEYVSKRWDIERSKFVRPFYPNGNYKKENYPDGCVVVDNPPFSLLAEIKRWYYVRGIRFFLFCPTLTAFSGKKTCDYTHIITAGRVVYENGAEVDTSFVTNLPSENVAETAIELQNEINRVAEMLRKRGKKELPKYEFPYELLTSARMRYMATHNTPFAVRRGECVCVPALDAMKKVGKGVYGGGLLLGERAAAERAAAEVWQLSEREKRLVAQLVPME